MRSSETFHPVAWLAWLAAAALPALSTRNPLYLSLVLLAAGVNYVALGRRSPLARSWSAFLRFGAFLWLLTIPFTMLTSHAGEIVIFRLPAAWPVIGGRITLEAFLYGLTSGLALLSLLLLFAVLNVAVDQARLLRMTPGFVYQAGVIAGIAVAFVPQMVASWQSIREAQQVRGHKVRGIRDLLPLLLPLLVTGLERAVQLAESMEARGFGGQLQAGTLRRRLFDQVAVFLGLALLGGGFAVAGFWRSRALLAGLLLAGGFALFAFGLWDQGRRVQRTRYFRWSWGRTDRLFLGASLAAFIAWGSAWLLREPTLLYYPYPPYTPWPAFNPALGLVIVTLALPAVLLAAASEPARATLRLSEGS